MALKVGRSVAGLSSSQSWSWFFLNAAVFFNGILSSSTAFLVAILARDALVSRRSSSTIHLVAGLASMVVELSHAFSRREIANVHGDNLDASQVGFLRLESLGTADAAGSHLGQIYIYIYISIGSPHC